MEKTNSENQMVSLNSKFSEFDLQELEERLETDPLAIGGLLDMTHASSSIGVTYNCSEFSCDNFYCPSHFVNW